MQIDNQLSSIHKFPYNGDLILAKFKHMERAILTQCFEIISKIYYKQNALAKQKIVSKD